MPAPLSTSHRPSDAAEYDIRGAQLDDGAAIWRFVNSDSGLDVNSCYAYLLLTSHFADTCLVAYDGTTLVGFVAGYVPPKAPDVLFIWQVGVAPQARGRSLGKRMIERLWTQVSQAAGGSGRFLEATVTPDNLASQGLFRSVAQRRGCSLELSPYFAGEHFGDSQHDEELLIRIGPLKE